jgi:heptosyltransferase II
VTSSRHKNLKRVLIVNPFGIGDALFLTPMVRALNEAGVRRVDVLLGSRTREIFENHPFINRIYTWDKEKCAGFQARVRKTISLIQMFWSLWRARYQVMIDCSLGRQYSFLALFLFWIPTRVGFNFKGRGTFLTHKIELPNAFVEKPVVEWYIDLLQFLNIDHRGMDFDLFVGNEDVVTVRTLLKQRNIDTGEPFIIVAPGGGESWGRDARLRRWPITHFAALLRLIRKSFGEQVGTILIVGGERDRCLSQELADRLGNRGVHDLCGQLPNIRITAALMREARCAIVNDSGLVHVASAMRTPLIAFYGPVDPNVYGPYPKRKSALAITHTGPECRPCYQKMRYQASCVGVECLSELMPVQVFEHVRSKSFFESHVRSRLRTGAPTLSAQ